MLTFKINLSQFICLGWTTLFIGLLMPINHALASEVNSGLEIVQKAKERDAGWQNMRANLSMLLRNAAGDTAQRQMRYQSLERDQSGGKSLIIFDFPKDVKGTVLLSFSHILNPDEQWLYVPVLRRVKRISGSNRAGAFMGSEFAFEDLGTFEVEKYNYKFIEEQVIDGLACWIVEQYPIDAASAYSRRKVWIDQAAYRTQQIMFYDKKNTLLKTLKMTHYQQYLDRHWRASEFLMVNHQTGKETQLQWQDIQFKTDQDVGSYSAHMLARIR